MLWYSTCDWYRGLAENLPSTLRACGRYGPSYLPISEWTTIWQDYIPMPPATPYRSPPGFTLLPGGWLFYRWWHILETGDVIRSHQFPKPSLVRPFLRSLSSIMPARSAAGRISQLPLSRRRRNEGYWSTLMWNGYIGAK